MSRVQDTDPSRRTAHISVLVLNSRLFSTTDQLDTLAFAPFS